MRLELGVQSQRHALTLSPRSSLLKRRTAGKGVVGASPKWELNWVRTKELANVRRSALVYWKFYLFSNASSFDYSDLGASERMHKVR